MMPVNWTKASDRVRPVGICRKKRHCRAGGPSTRCSANAMDVILEGLGDVVVHHIGHIFDVKAWPREMVDGEVYKFDVGPL